MPLPVMVTLSMARSNYAGPKMNVLCYCIRRLRWPVKRFLQVHGLTIKGEISGCDIVGVSADEPPLVVVCELKVRFNLELVLQGIERASACDEVWLAARRSGHGKGREHDPRFRALCRRLGFGLLRVSRDGAVEVLLSPAALAAASQSGHR
jgi:hypothetical protein